MQSALETTKGVPPTPTESATALPPAITIRIIRAFRAVGHILEWDLCISFAHCEPLATKRYHFPNATVWISDDSGDEVS
jgi:hypothetical protein